MIKQVKILSGISGSGKSTYAEKIAAHHANCVIVSADDFFYQESEEYRFDPSKLGEAHAYCFREFLRAMQPFGGFAEAELILVDNTNTTGEEIAPYVLGSAAFGYDCEIVTIGGYLENDNLAICCARGKHKVPMSALREQSHRIGIRQLPRYWKETRIPFQQSE
jgi:predicted ABC-type ATPase